MMVRAVAVALALVGPASAQTNCAIRSEIVARLVDKYGEHITGAGLQTEAAIFEIWFSAEKRTWTILKSTPNGWSCIMASGNGWESYAVKPQGENG